MSKNRIPQFAPRNEQNGSTDEVVQLKALGYDTISQMEVLQNRLRQINARIGELAGATGARPEPAAAPPAPEPSGE